MKILFNLILTSLLLLFFAIFFISTFGAYKGDSGYVIDDVQGIVITDNSLFIGIGPSYKNVIHEYSLPDFKLEKIHNVNGNNKGYYFMVEKDDYEIISLPKGSISNNKKSPLEIIVNALPDKYYHTPVDSSKNSYNVSNSGFNTKLTITNSSGIEIKNIQLQNWIYFLFKKFIAFVPLFFIATLLLALNPNLLSWLTEVGNKRYETRK